MTAKQWTPEADEFLIQYGLGTPISKLMRYFDGASPGAITARAAELGITVGAHASSEEVPGLEHLPCVPADAQRFEWDKGVYFRIPAHGQPGFHGITVHIQRHSGNTHRRDRVAVESVGDDELPANEPDFSRLLAAA